MNVVVEMGMLQTRHTWNYVKVSTSEDLVVRSTCSSFINCDTFPNPDVNECGSNTTHNCSEADNEICEDTDGSYMCICMPGFDGEPCRG